MRILFDQNTPVPIRDSLQKHDVSTAHEMGWSTLENGNLLSTAEEHGFDLFITADRNLKYQQNLARPSLSIIVLSTTSWPRIKNSASKVISAVDEIVNGGFIEIEIP